jgi:hypothetical protein
MNRRELFFYIPIGLVAAVFIPIQLIESILDKIGSFYSTIYWIGVIGMFSCSLPFIVLSLLSVTNKYGWIGDKIERWLTYAPRKMKEEQVLK